MRRIGPCTLPALAALTFAIALTASPAFAADAVRIAAPPPYSPIAVVFAAEGLGYFKEKGIQAEISTYRGGAAVQEALAAGAADLAAVSAPGAAIAVQKGVKQKIVALAGPTSPRGWYLIVPADSPIKTAGDLNGKKVGITGKGSSTDFFALASAKEGSATIQSIPLGAGILPALKAKQIDAGVIWPLTSFKSVFSGEYRIVSDYGSLKETSMDVWTASQELIEKRPDVLKRWVEAMNKALAKLQSDEAYALGFLAKYHEESDSKALKAAYDQMIKPMRPDHLVKAEWVDSTLKLAAASGVDGLPRAADLIDARFTPAGR